MPPANKLLLPGLPYTLPNNSQQNLLLEGDVSDHIYFGLFLILNNCIVSSQISFVEVEHFLTLPGKTSKEDNEYSVLRSKVVSVCSFITAGQLSWDTRA